MISNIPSNGQFQYHLWKQIDQTVNNDGIHCCIIVGSTVWAGMQDGTIGIWHIRTGELVGQRQAHRAKIFAMCLVGDFVWTAGQDNKVRRWTQAAVYYDELGLQLASEISSMAHANDEMWIGSVGGRVQVFDVKTKVSKAIIDSKRQTPIRCLFCEGEKIWVGLENEILRINKKTREIIDCLEGSRVNAIVKPTEKTVWSASSDSSITVYDAETGKVVKKLLGHKDFVFTLTVFGSCVWSGGWDCTIRVWDANDFTLVKTLDGHKEPLNTINVIPIELPINVEETPVQISEELKPVSTPTRRFEFSNFFSPFSTPTKLVDSTVSGSTPTKYEELTSHTDTHKQSSTLQNTMCTVYAVWSTSWEGSILMWI